MSDDRSNPLESKEFQILKVMKLVLTDVVKDTATQPGLKHPLSDRTIEGIRQCLRLISARERELVEDAGKTMDMPPTTWTSRRRMSWCRLPKSAAIPRRIRKKSNAGWVEGTKPNKHISPDREYGARGHRRNP